MTRDFAKPLLFAPLCAILACAACSSGPERIATEDDARSTFTQEEKRAAQSLSLGNDPAAIQPSSDYEKALYCQIAVNWTFERLSDAQPVMANQEVAMQRVLALFDQQVETMARSASRTARDIEDDRAQAKEKFGEGANLGRAAISCIRDAQNRASAQDS